MASVLTCREAFAVYDASGNQAFVRAGDTVEDDHPFVRGHEAKFEPFAVTHQTPETKKPRKQ